MSQTYYVNGNKLTFTNKEYKAAGGEGTIYKKGNIIYKIFHDYQKAQSTPPAKVEELSKLLTKNNILTPIDQIYDSNNKYIGFTMPYVSDTQALCRIFTNAYRREKNIKQENILNLVEHFQEDLHYIHKQKCLIVDLNEFNFLVDEKTFSCVYFIDTGCYQTPSFQATAITPGIRDYHTNNFSELTDWFSFAILTCQLFIGIHPYRGMHPNYKANELVERMKNNISIFRKDVVIPPSVKSFDSIPKEYFAWFVKLFEKGERVPPPTIAGFMAISPTLTVVQSTGNLNISLISEFNENIRNFFSHGQNYAVVLNKTIAFDNKKQIPISDNNAIVKFTSSQNPIIVESLNELNFNHYDMGYNKSIDNINSVKTKIDKKFISDNKLYVVFDDKFMEIIHTEIGNKTVFSGSLSREFMNNSSEVFDGLIYQDTLGIPFFIIPYNDNGISCCMIKPFNELKSYKIVSAKHDLGILMVIGYKDNKYDKFIFRIDDKYNDYECFKILTDIQNIELNFTTLENGVVAHIPEDGELEIFFRKIGNDKVRIIKDNNIKITMSLYKFNGKVVFTLDNKLFSLSLK